MVTICTNSFKNQKFCVLPTEYVDGCHILHSVIIFFSSINQMVFMMATVLFFDVRTQYLKELKKSKFCCLSLSDVYYLSL
jgi:hypothetical protein